MADVLNNPIVVLGGGQPSPIPEYEDHGIIWNGKCRIRYFDIDGTLLKIEYVYKGGYTSPPAHPNYDPEYLVFAEWNYDTTADPVQQPMDIGATYNTIDGRTYIFINVNQFTGYAARLSMQVVQVDWGDGTIDDQFTHTYTADGKYIIKIVCNNESKWYTNTGMLNKPENGSDVYYYSYGLNSAITKIYVGDGGWNAIGANFDSCANLEIISLPPKIFQIEASNETNVNGCYNLQAIIMPRNWTLGLVVGKNYTIKAVSVPKVANPNNNIKTSVLYYRGGEIIQPYGAATINATDYPIYFVPETVTRMRTMDISESTTVLIITTPIVPQLLIVPDSEPIYNNTQLIVYVKDELVNQFKTATNWSIFGDRFKPLSTSPYNF